MRLAVRRTLAIGTAPVGRPGPRGRLANGDGRSSVSDAAAISLSAVLLCPR